MTGKNMNRTGLKNRYVGYWCRKLFRVDKSLWNEWGQKDEKKVLEVR